MIIYVSVNAALNGNGTKERPFKTINEAAQIAKAGDEIIVAPGLYREEVNPVNGGINDEQRIIYRSEKIGKAVIKGSEVVQNWKPYEGTVWYAEIPNGVFNGDNLFTTEIKADWFVPPAPVHLGEIFLNEKAMYETQSLEQVLFPKASERSWDPDGSLYQWYSEQKDGKTILYANFHGTDPNHELVEITTRRHCFYPSRTGINYITLSGFTIKQAAPQWAPPTAYQEGMVGPHWSKGWIIEDCEISDARCVGISLGKYLQPNNENKWRFKYLKDGTQTERDAICQAQLEGWTKEKIGSHIVRRCNIHDCGQAGIVGHLGGVFSLIEDNHIHHICNKGDLFGFEIAGIKLHAAIDVIIRRNHIHHCARGIWLDWQAQGTRVTGNILHNNTSPVSGGGIFAGEDLFIEVSHGPTLADHNLMLSDNSIRICAQGVAFAHNLITGFVTGVGTGTDNGGTHLPTPRYTPYHIPHRTEVAGFMTILHGDARFYNNIFVQRPVTEEEQAMLKQMEEKRGIKMILEGGTKPYDGYPTAEKYFAQFTEETFNNYLMKDIYYDHLPVYTGGNVYFNEALPCDTEVNYWRDEKHTIDLTVSEEDGLYVLHTNLFDFVPHFSTGLVSTELMGEAFEPEQQFENPDGSPIRMDTDFLGNHRSINPVSGPFETVGREGIKLSEYFFIKI